MFLQFTHVSSEPNLNLIMLFLLGLICLVFIRIYLNESVDDKPNSFYQECGRDLIIDEIKTELEQEFKIYDICHAMYQLGIVLSWPRYEDGYEPSGDGPVVLKFTNPEKDPVVDTEISLIHKIMQRICNAYECGYMISEMNRSKDDELVVYVGIFEMDVDE